MALADVIFCGLTSRCPSYLQVRESFMFEVNPVLNKLKELSERTELLRGYL